MSKLAENTGSAVPRPIFIVGSGRSGTSVLTWAIGQHPNIIVLPETNWLTALASYLQTFYNIGCAAGVNHLTRFDVDLQTFYRHFGNGVDALMRESFEAKFPNRHSKLMAQEVDGLAWCRSLDDPKQRWVDGTPSSTPYASILAEMFPEAKFINLVRKPADVVHSWMGISWRAKEHADANKLVEHIFYSQWLGYLTQAALGPDRAMRVRFEDLISNPEQGMKAIAAFIGEEYTPNMVKPLMAGKINSTGAAKAEAEQELTTILDSPALAQMQRWYDAARNRDWQISSREYAANELTPYASRKMHGTQNPVQPRRPPAVALAEASKKAPPKRTILARLKKNLHWKKLLRWEKIFPR